jgi:hypothetical protein
METSENLVACIDLGSVVQRWVGANSGLKFNLLF